MKKNRKTMPVLYLTHGAIIAALYVVLTILFVPLSFGEIQVRIAEALTILPLFTPAAIPGLFVGCIIGNLIGGALPPDVIFGSLATLIGAFGTYLLRKRNPILCTLPPIISNTLIIPLILRFAYGIPLSIPFLMFTVGLGEVASCLGLGVVLYFLLQRYRQVIFQ